MLLSPLCRVGQVPRWTRWAAADLGDLRLIIAEGLLGEVVPGRSVSASAAAETEHTELTVAALALKVVGVA